MGDIIVLLFTIGFILIGMDYVFKVFGFGLQAWYRRLLKGWQKKMVRKVKAFVKWSWTNYKQFIIGVVVGLLIAFLMSQPQ